MSLNHPMTHSGEPESRLSFLNIEPFEVLVTFLTFIDFLLKNTQHSVYTTVYTIHFHLDVPCHT